MSPDAYLEMADTEARHWWFVGRRAVSTSLIEEFGLTRNSRILEIGSGTGGNLEMLGAFGNTSATELDETARSIAIKKTGGRFDIRPGRCPDDIPFAGETFDLICMFDVLEHIDEDVETLVALKRLLADGGRVLVTVPAYRWMWSRHDEFLHHKRRYTANELSTKFAAAGLRAEKLSYFNTLLFPIAAAVRLKDRLFGEVSASGTDVPPSFINMLFGKLFGAERYLLKSMNLPFGVSLLAVLRVD